MQIWIELGKQLCMAVSEYDLNRGRLVLRYWEYVRLFTTLKACHITRLRVMYIVTVL
jgi:hypothetical protein